MDLFYGVVEPPVVGVQNALDKGKVPMQGGGGPFHPNGDVVDVIPELPQEGSPSDRRRQE